MRCYRKCRRCSSFIRKTRIVAFHLRGDNLYRHIIIHHVLARLRGDIVHFITSFNCSLPWIIDTASNLNSHFDTNATQPDTYFRGELRPAHHLRTIRVFFPFFLSCRCCHRAQALEYKFHHLRRRRATARPASTPSLHQLRRRTSRTTPTTRTLDSTTPETFLTTRASPHRHSGLSSHRADSKFFLHLHSSTPSFFIRNRHIRRR